MSVKFKSKYLKQFVEEIQFHNRNPQDIKALDLLKDISTNPEIVFSSHQYLYRSRIISNMNEINKVPNFYGYDCDQSFVPQAKLSRDLRANYRYIPYLYCSNDPYTALVEVRPRLGASVSVATISIQDKVRLLDFTISSRPSKMSEAKKNLFDDLSKLFSTPVTDADDVLDYIPTQFIAEFAKNVLGYDGIAYTSSLTPEIDESAQRYNIVVFNYKKCTPIKSNVFTITGNYMDVQRADMDPNGYDIKSYLGEKLDNRLKGI